MAFVEAVGVVGQRPAWLGLDVPGDRTGGEREIAAATGDACGGLRVGTDGSPGYGFVEKRLGLAGGEYVHREMCRGVQVGEAAPAGDQYRAARGVGQQGADLVGVGGVVEHDQSAAAGQP